MPSVVSFELSPTVTSAVGCASSTTVKVAVPPASVVVSPLVGVTVMPDVSLSVFVTDDVAGVQAVVVRRRALVAAAVTML